MNIIKYTVFLLLISLAGSVYATVRLPRLIADGMILQRDTQVKIWGWAAPSEKITVNIADQRLTCVANVAGEWFVLLSSPKAGGPYVMEIQGENTIKINNILFGDVWLCSGQSNMELAMNRVKPIYEDVIQNSKNTNIRTFVVPIRYNFKGENVDFESGIWQEANPENILKFSAVAYFFALELYKKYNIPIGLINASLGGSPIESWMSADALKNFPTQLNEAIMFKNDDLIKQIESADRAKTNAWYKESVKKDEGLKNHFIQPDIDDSKWLTMNVPDFWVNTSLGAVNGVVWFRKVIEVSPEDAGKPASLILGRIVDADSVFINAKFIGSVSYQYPPRRYNVSKNILVPGKNTIVVRIVSNAGLGGFVPDKPYELKIAGKVIDLKGIWKMKLGTTMPPLAEETFIRWKPTGLYNAMVAPLKNYCFKGTIWYQGESNTGNPVDYGLKFTTLIQDWRNKFQLPELPFLFVQLPNFLEADNQPSESNWAKIRELQMKALTVPQTGMSVTIDIGEWNDIHPLNKKDVGNRLALAAQKVAYHDTVITYSGPIFESMEVKKNKIALTFVQTGSGLLAKGQKELKQFAIAGADKKFVWAKAEIENNKIIVWSDDVPSPVAVRYAWADNPQGANLYNQEGLPASPFRTDSW